MQEHSVITEFNATPLIGRCPGFGPRSGGCRTVIHADGTYRDGQPALELVWRPPAGREEKEAHR